ncbi:MAG: tyrosine--tRNA ligase [Candidatus Wildermuthbacteria bacterium]|nr:tyrosine--tRNA ligase [Candidatus Wildermuthbacteria bacterium]
MKKVSVSIGDTLSKQVEEILPSREGLESLMKKRKIRLYLGVDPTGVNLHLGHAVVLRKLRQFQELGHEVILLFGTFTGLIGDPSGRDKAREPLSLAQIRKNMAAYKKQAGKILDLSKTKVKCNGDWLSKLKPEEFLKIASCFTASQLLERDMFQNRMKKGAEVWVNELLYPLLQGYDSVAMDVDLEVGGTDQMFNMLIGRRLQKLYNDKEKYVLTTPLLLGLDGRKMSKSYGNTVNILDSAQEMYGKLMSLRDDLISHYFELCCEVSPQEMEGLAPRDAKERLAKEIVTLFHSKALAEKAAQEFNQVFREKKNPSRIPEIQTTRASLTLTELVLEAGFASSKSAARRLIKQGGIRVDKRVEDNPNTLVQLKKGMVIQAGKRRFVKVV